MRFQSSGKLLITGEYLVLKGAKALAVPLNFQQTLDITKSDNPGFHWESNEKGKPWFRATFNKPLFEFIETNDRDIVNPLIKILTSALELNPGFGIKLENTNVISNMDFNRRWGFGSSSSLISNIAYWAEVDVFELHKKVSQGSGYDVLISRENGPMVFQLVEENYTLTKANFAPEFKNEVFFVYLGKKQDSAKSVLDFKQSKKNLRSEVEQISEITYHLKKAHSLDDFEYFVREHEQILASVLKQRPIKETIFKSIQGEAKSLGAWGGDFAMVTWQYGKSDLKKQLEKINLDTVFEFDELIKTW